MILTTIPLAAITERLDARAIHPHGVAALAKKMQLLGFLPQFPLLVSTKTDGTYRLLDGRHRVEAAGQAGLTEAPALIREPCTDFLEEIAIARASNEASGTNVQTTLVDNAELVWRLSDVEYTQAQIATALGAKWSRDRVADHISLRQVHGDAWKIIVATFQGAPDIGEDEPATRDVADATKSPFTEGLLRNILDLSDRQQLLLCTKLAKTAGGKGYTKTDFRQDAQSFTAYNQLLGAMHEGLSVIPEAERDDYEDAMVKALYPNKKTEAARSEYITEWFKDKRPGVKFAKLLQAQLDAYAKKTSVRVFCCDIQLLTEADVADDSIDAIVTDPPYTHEAITLFATLGKVAERLLKPGGSLLVLCGQSYLSEYFAALEESLTYRWTLACHLPGGQAVQIWTAEVMTFWKAVLWFVKDPFPGQKWVSDHFSTPVNSNDKRFHKWGQSEHCIRELLERFTTPGETIYDPFLGGGTTGVVAKAMGRKFIGSDCDETLVQQALTRIHRTA